MLRIRITFDTNPDSLDLHGADPIPDFIWCEFRIHFIPLVRIRLLIFFDADLKTCGSGSGTLVFPSYLTWDDNCSPFYYGIYYFIRKGDGRGQGQALFSQPWGLDDPIYVSTVFYFIYVLLDRWGLQLYLLIYLLFSQEGFHDGDVAHNSLCWYFFFSRSYSSLYPTLEVLKHIGWLANNLYSKPIMFFTEFT